MKRSHAYLLIALLGLVLFIWLLPPERYPGTTKKLFSYTAEDVKTIEYKSEKQDYTVKSYPLPDWGDKKIHWKIHLISKESEKKDATFFANGLDGMISELASLEYLYDIENDVSKHDEYGLKECPSYVKLNTSKQAHFICLGLKNYNQTKKYFWPKGSPKIYVMTSYLMNRFENNILTRMNKQLFFQNEQMLGSFSIRFNKKVTRKYPRFFAGTDGTLEFVLMELRDNVKLWNIKSQPSDISKKANVLYSLFVNFRLSSVAQGKIPKSLGNPVVEVTFYSKHKKSSAKPESYQLWNTPHSPKIKFLPEQTKLKDRSSHFVGASPHHWGIYPSGEFDKIKKELQRLENALNEKILKQKKEQERKETSKNTKEDTKQIGSNKTKKSGKSIK